MLPNGCRWGGHHCRAFECSLYKCVFSSKFSRRKARKLWKVDIGPPGKGNSTSYVARPVHQIISMTKWIRTSRLSIKDCLSLTRAGGGSITAEALNALRDHWPRKPLCGGIPSPFLEPSPRSWSHFVGVYRQILTTSLNN